MSSVYCYDLAARWTAPHAIAYSSSFIQWRTHPHQLRIAWVLYRNIISSNKIIGLCRTLLSTGPRLVKFELGPQKLFPQGFVHHFVMSKVAGIHQQAKLVDECPPNVFEIRASGNQELIYPENKSSLDRSTAIANTTASKMSENDFHSQSLARSGHDLRPLQRLVHNGCLVWGWTSLRHSQTDRTAWKWWSHTMKIRMEP